MAQVDGPPLDPACEPKPLLAGPAASTAPTVQNRFDSFGFLTSEYKPLEQPHDDRDDDSDTFSVFVSPGFSRKIHSEEFRIAKWNDYLKTASPKTVKDSKKARKMVIYGIPTTLRPRVWQFFAEEAKIRQSGFYEDLLNRERIPIFDVIERDIPRCYPDHQLFCDNQSEGQRQLFDILKAYAHYNPEVGYCQGMGRLVGVFLMQHMSAEDSFWLLAATIRQYLPQYYVPTLTQVRIDSAVFEKLLQEHNRKLANHFAVNDITPLMYVTSWFMTLFTMTLPWASVLRVWDWFYLKGTKILFRIGLAILDCISDHLLTECPTNSEILQYLLHIPKDKLAPEHLFAAANRVRIKTHHIDRLSRQVTLHGVPARGELSTSESRSPQKSSKRRVFQRVFSP